MIGRLASLACFTAILSCASAPTPPPAASASISDYVPLRMGASWTYRIRFPGQTGKRTITVVDRQDGYFVDDAGGRFKLTKEGLRDPQRFVIRTPLRPGVRWKSVVSASAVESYEIVSVGEACQAVAGTFSDCLVVRGALPQDPKHTLHIRFTWAKDVGLVKIETELEAGEERIPQTEQSLIHYDLSGQAKADEKGPPDEWN